MGDNADLSGNPDLNSPWKAYAYCRACSPDGPCRSYDNGRASSRDRTKAREGLLRTATGSLQPDLPAKSSQFGTCRPAHGGSNIINCCHFSLPLRPTAHEYRSFLCLLKTADPVRALTRGECGDPRYRTAFHDIGGNGLPHPLQRYKGPAHKSDFQVTNLVRLQKPKTLAFYYRSQTQAGPVGAANPAPAWPSPSR